MISNRFRDDIQCYKYNYYFPMIRAIGDMKRLRFFDESGFQCKYLGRKRGRAPRGQDLKMEIPNASRRYFTLGAITSALQGTAPLLGVLYDGGMHHEDLIEFFRRGEILDSFHQGDVLIWDNCRTHPTKFVNYIVQALARRGAMVAFLPQYHPHFNPIELTFGWIKERLSHCCDRGNYLSLLNEINNRINCVTVDMMQGWYRKARREMVAEGC